MNASGIRTADESRRDFSGKGFRSACYAPFVALYFTTNGDVIACCQNRTSILGNVARDRLPAIWNGRQIAMLREALIDYRFDQGCAYCEWQIKTSKDGSSFRTLFDRFAVSSPQPEWPVQIDFVASNVCNFECVMCYGTLSSSIRTNVQGLPPLKKVYDDQFFEDLEPFLPHLQWMNFLGGEPFLSAEAYRIWETMQSAGLSIPCHVTTNASYYNAKVERVLEAVPMHFAVSLDGATKSTFEAIRHKSSFEVVVTNLHRFHAYTRSRGTSLNIAFCLMRQNWHEFLDVLRLADRLDCDVVVNTVIDPSHCSLFTLPNDELLAVVRAFDRQSPLATAELRRNRTVWEAWVENLRTALKPNVTETAETVMSANLALHEDPLTQAWRLVDRHEYDAALVEAQKVDARNPDHYFALLLSAQVHALQDRWAQAREDLQQALRISQKLPQAFLGLARVALRQGHTDEALQNLLRASALATPEDPADAQIHAALACAYLRQLRLIRAYRAIAYWAALPSNARSARLEDDAALQPRSSGVGSRRDDFLVGALLRIARRARAMAIATGMRRFGRLSPGLHPPRRGSDSAVQPPLVDGSAYLKGTSAESLAVPALRVASGTKAILVPLSLEPGGLRVVVQRGSTAPAHDIQLNYPGLMLARNRTYVVRFKVRADAARQINWGIAMAREPWSNLGLYRTLEIGPQWQEVNEHFASEVPEDRGRVHFDLAGSEVSVEFGPLVIAEAEIA